MLKVMLIDDEPYILQGLQVLVNWESEGYEIAAVMTNGRDAYNYLKENQVDLIISDIQMPNMTGIELLDAITKENISDAKFVILTGYDDFSYMQKAIRNNCFDYILKPVNKEELITLLRKVSNLNKESIILKENQEKMADAYLASNVIALLKGKYGDDDLEYVNNHMQITGGVRFIDIELADEYENSEATDSDDYDMRLVQRQLYNACREVLKENANHFIFDVSYDEDNYDIGFIYCDNMATRRDLSEEEFLNLMLRKIEVIMTKPIRMLCGKKVPGIAALSKSYSSCSRLNSIKGFHNQKKIYLYEDEVQVGQNGIVLCKNTIDDVIASIENNDTEKIDSEIDRLFVEMSSGDNSGSTVDLNINYLLFQLIHLASEQDDSINQEEIVQYISEHSFESTLNRGSNQHMKRFAKEYANYLSELRKSVSRGILADVENEIKDHFAENISLRYLGDKYHINSSYLGQVFRKKYGMSFKNYLTNYRIKEAAKQVINTEKKINQIAEDVGYKDTDYFIRKFIEIKGCTPSKYRKTNR
ncbi:MAG: response regulator [Clostridia bacterium]|nr:response regulator [Clostridia bacterium]